MHREVAGSARLHLFQELSNLVSSSCARLCSVGPRQSRARASSVDVSDRLHEKEWGPSLDFGSPTPS